MAAATISVPIYETVGDLLKQIGDIPPERIRLDPRPGEATEEDVVYSKSRFGCLCELVDGVLVQKTIGFYESILAGLVGSRIGLFLMEADLGIVLGPDGPMRTMPGRVRLPDVSFFSWDHFPGHLLPPGQILDMAPDLAVEVLSPSNTKDEMLRKRQEYFAGGTRLVWEVDPEKRTVRVYTSPTRSRLLREDKTLDGGDVLPGFKLSIRTLFTRAGKRRK